ncbi:MAG: hypothetical protein HXS41_00980 [Theionarchaea archaeon]|nr:hypothetical protein [Theionarchaea archaeon]MBU6999274.1 hypothetical protein [Theionarchaea archaeon]MBU7019601.1 hypothetical protein [Theionarchaea archaeon]MBU7033780.1 hypothetical protein [Theionarchaea archaeon]MBU7039410.1 hypothetical protein [Theionarchaea archaeon]
MDFPTGALQREAEVRELDTLLRELGEIEFTGVIKYIDHETGSLLMIDGKVRAATYEKSGGEEALEKIWNAVDGTLSVYSLEKERAEFALKWYTDIHGFPSVSSDVLTHEVTVPVPNVDDLVKMLEREGISHLMTKKPSGIPIEKRAHEKPYEILKDIEAFLADLFGDFMSETIVRSHLMKLNINERHITTGELDTLVSEICRNVLERVMDEKIAGEESRKLRELLQQK